MLFLKVRKVIVHFKEKLLSSLIFKKIIPVMSDIVNIIKLSANALYWFLLSSNISCVTFSSIFFLSILQYHYFLLFSSLSVFPFSSLSRVILIFSRCLCCITPLLGTDNFQKKINRVAVLVYFHHFYFTANLLKSACSRSHGLFFLFVLSYFHPLQCQYTQICSNCSLLYNSMKLCSCNH